MATDEEYSLTWKGHTQHVRDSFSKLFQKNAFCDVTLYAEGQKIGAHKVFLTACSGYFNQLFVDLPEERPIIVLKGMQFEILKHILRFIYNGQVSIETEKLNEFLEAAEFLEVHGLVNNDKAAKLPRRLVASEADTERRDSQRPTENNDSLVTRLLEYEGYRFFQNSQNDNAKPGKEQNLNSELGKRTNDWTSDYESVDNREKKKIKIEAIDVRDFDNSLDAEIDDDGDELETEMLLTSVTTVTENGFQCNLCNNTYLLKDLLKKHFSVHLKNSTCTICGLTLSRMSHLKRHMKRHTRTTQGVGE